jgi:hypothetical protein
MATSGWEPASGPVTDAGGIGQQLVQQDPGPSAEVAAGGPQRGQVTGAADVPGVALGREQALLAAP